ncbi:MAG: YceH family protein [Betaproteobacteria bacterium]
MTLATLSLLETRILGTLAEKERTVPDSYPLTLNALASGCNQKTSRDPVMDASDAEIQAGIDSLKGYSLVMESSGGRVSRYEHNLQRVLQVPSQSTALLTILMLRGPQTAGELRIASERLHKFADISAVEAFLHELAERPAGALVMELPRLPGARENRWAHLLSGTPEVDQPAVRATPNADVSVGEVAALKANVARLESEVVALRSLVGRVCAELGIDPSPADKS